MLGANSSCTWCRLADGGRLVGLYVCPLGTAIDKAAVCKLSMLSYLWELQLLGNSGSTLDNANVQGSVQVLATCAPELHD